MGAANYVYTHLQVNKHTVHPPIAITVSFPTQATPIFTHPFSVFSVNHSSSPVLPPVCHLSHISTSISIWNHSPKFLETTHVCWPQLILQLNLLHCFYHCIALFVSRASQVCFYLELLHTLFLLVGKHCPRSFRVCSLSSRDPKDSPQGWTFHLCESLSFSAQHLFHPLPMIFYHLQLSSTWLPTDLVLLVCKVPVQEKLQILLTISNSSAQKSACYTLNAHWIFAI